MEGYHAAVRAPIEAQGGTVVQLLGGGVMCAFGVPRMAEDDALRAVRAAVDVQASFREFLGEHTRHATRRKNCATRLCWSKGNGGLR